MRLVTAIGGALRALAGNKTRSALSALGIVIGVSAVIVTASIGAGTQRRVAEQIELLGANLVSVRSGSAITAGARLGAGARMTLTQDDAAAIAAEIDAVAISGVVWWAGGQAIHGNRNWVTPIHGIDPEYLAARNWTAEHGRLISGSDVEATRKVALLGRTVADELYGDEDPVGQIVRLRNVPFQVVGVLEAKGHSLGGQDHDDIVFVPISTARSTVTITAAASQRPVSAIAGTQRYTGAVQVAPPAGVASTLRRPPQAGQIKPNVVSAILVRVSDPEHIDGAIAEISRLLRQRHRLADSAPDDFRVRSLAEAARVQQASSETLSIMLAAIAAVSLLVGGIGIMNIMLVSVAERRGEIGLRMAVGARRRDILQQFLIEAATLAFAGGLIGVTAGVGGSIVAARLLDLDLVIALAPTLTALLVSAAVGVAFGLYPALRAARLDPAVALRQG
ncbi:MAG TPA: ABC transporter permease [Alphaproteobacteria bacterium]|nr:ABC transporter permease [Alphaproteobacteria bacterium]